MVGSKCMIISYNMDICSLAVLRADLRKFGLPQTGSRLQMSARLTKAIKGGKEKQDLPNKVKKPSTKRATAEKDTAPKKKAKKKTAPAAKRAPAKK